MADEIGIYFTQAQIGPMANFIYLIGDVNTGECTVVDPAWDIPKIEEIAAKDGMKITSALITHHHFDHTNGLSNLLKNNDIPVYINKHDAEFVKAAGDTRVLVEGGDSLKIGDVEITFIHTPGHTPGSQCFSVMNSLVAGDTLFIDGCGRTDFPGGSAEEMYDSIHNKLMKLDPQTILFPGHNYGVKPYATMEEQAKTNVFMRATRLDQFLMMTGS